MEKFSHINPKADRPHEQYSLHIYQSFGEPSWMFNVSIFTTVDIDHDYHEKVRGVSDKCVWRTVKCFLIIPCPVVNVEDKIQQPGLRSHDDQ